MTITNTKIHSFQHAPTALTTIFQAGHFAMHTGNRNPRKEPAALHAPGAGLAAESGNTMAFIFFSLIVHRMNINYSL